MRARAVRTDSAEKTVRDIRRATRRQYSGGSNPHALAGNLRRVAIQDAEVRILPPRLRVLTNSDSEMQRFESTSPSQAVSL